MTTNLYKQASSVARSLDHELRAIFDGLDPNAAQPLLARLSSDPHPTPLLVFTGYHSAGKSTLIAALTDRAFHIPIGSGVTTDVVTEYDWDEDIKLVDTPGVRADRPAHDELAERALQSADLVLFAVPVELFDDTLVAHLRDVLGRLAKSRQTLIVVTKAGTMEAAPGHREAAIKEALGSFAAAPWVECDAQFYLDGIDLRDTAPAESAAFIEASGMDRVEALINTFAGRQGELGRLSQPLQLIAALSLEATASLTEDPNEQAALTVLARQRSALSGKRVHLDGLLRARFGQFRSEAIQAASKFADAVEVAEQAEVRESFDLDSLTSALNEDLRTAAERFHDAVTQVLEIQLDDLASEILAIEASPHGRIVVQVAEVAEVELQERDVTVRADGALTSTTSRWAGDLSQFLKEFNGFWGAGNGVKAAAGSNGHQIVLKVGHAFGKSFKPWEAVRTANTIGKVVKVGGVVFTVGAELYGAVAEERVAVKAEEARAQRRRNITQEILAQADAIAAEALQAVTAELDAMFKPELERIDAVANEIRGARSARTDLRDRLDAVRQRAHETLTLLDSVDPSS